MNIGGETRLLDVIGHPIGHSLSPKMHNAAFAAAGMDYVCVPLDVKPERLEDAVRGLAALGFVGFNVTMPHKEEIIPLLDELDEPVRISGAVNTVMIRDGVLFGLNTDGGGFVEACTECGVRFADREVLLLGAGGAAAAVGAAVLGGGVHGLTIANRTVRRVEELREKLLKLDAAAELRVRRLGKLSLEDARRGDIIINTTYLGMRDDDPLPIPDDFLKEDRIICDAVYRRQKETVLIRRARERGARVVPGERMLIYQGVQAQRVWTGWEPSVEVMTGALAQ